MIHSTNGLSRQLRIALSVQILLSVFLGTIMVPMMTGLPVSTTLLFAGVSTLTFHFFTRGKIPLFYSCSFVYIGGMIMVREACMARGMTEAMGLCYACIGAFLSGLVYVIFSQVMRQVTQQRLLNWFPPVLIGSYIIALGIAMASSTIDFIIDDLLVSLTAIIVSIAVLFFSKGKLKIVPFNVGMLAAVVVCAVEGKIDMSQLNNEPWVASPFDRTYFAMSVFEEYDADMLILSVATLLPLTMISLVEHFADIFAISKTTKIDYMRTIGLHRTLSANGFTTILSTMFGASPTSSFSQTIGLVRVIRICDPVLFRIAAMMMILLAFSPKLTALIAVIPVAAIGGLTLIMYLMVVQVGVRTLGKMGTDLYKWRNIVIIVVVLALLVVIRFFFDDSVMVFGVGFSALTIAVVAGWLLNLILPKIKK